MRKEATAREEETMKKVTTSRISRLAAGAVLAAAFATTASAADQIKVSIGHKGIWDSMIVPECVSTGICKKFGIDPQIVWAQGGSSTLQAAVTGSVDMAMTNGTLGVLAAYSRGAKLRIVSAEATGAHDMFFYVLADSPIKDIAKANGKTIGFSEPGSSTDLAERALAKQFKVDLKMVPAGGIPATRTQVLSHQIDIGWSVPPFNLDLLHEGKIRIIARGGQIKSLSNETVRVNVATLSYVKEHSDVLKRFFKAYQATLDWMYSHSDQWLKTYAQLNKIDIKTARESMEYYPKAALNPAHLVGLEQINQQAVQMGKMDKPLTKQQLAEVVDLMAK
jgi:NitT/TauT family transport system substrate-binding protein